MPRILLAGLYHESNAFAPDSVGPEAFRRRSGEEMLAARGDGSALDGGLAAAHELGWEVVAGVHMHGGTGAPASPEVLEAFWSDLEPRIEKVDGVWIELHGAMAAADMPDVEGELLRRLRQVVGPRTPIVAPLDLHGNVSEAMVRYADAFVAFRKNPHTDIFNTALAAGRLLDRLISSGERPHTAFRTLPFLWPPSRTATDDAPMRPLLDLADAWRERVLAVNVMAGFAFADGPHVGASILVHGAEQPSEQCADELTALAGEIGAEAHPRLVGLAEAIARLKERPSGLNVLIEPADNIGGGAPGDLNEVLAALVEAEVQACVCLFDPESVDAVAGREPGSIVAVGIGGKSGVPGSVPLAVEAKLIGCTDGEYDLEDRNSPSATYGLRQRMGPCALLQVGSCKVLLNSVPTPPNDLGMWRSQGVSPEEEFAVVVKAAAAHRRAYDPITAWSIVLDTDGPCSERLTRHPYRDLRRPIWPLDA